MSVPVEYTRNDWHLKSDTCLWLVVFAQAWWFLANQIGGIKWAQTVLFFHRSFYLCTAVRSVIIIVLTNIKKNVFRTAYCTFNYFQKTSSSIQQVDRTSFTFFFPFSTLQLVLGHYEIYRRIIYRLQVNSLTANVLNHFMCAHQRLWSTCQKSYFESCFRGKKSMTAQQKLWYISTNLHICNPMTFLRKAGYTDQMP